MKATKKLWNMYYSFLTKTHTLKLEYQKYGQEDE